MERCGWERERASSNLDNTQVKGLLFLSAYWKKLYQGVPDLTIREGAIEVCAKLEECHQRHKAHVGNPLG